MTSPPSTAKGDRLLQAFEGRARRIRLFLRRWPALDPLVGWIGLKVWKRKLRRAAVGLEISSDPMRLLDIDPRRVHWALWRLDLLRRFGLSEQRELLGQIRGGDWDEAAFPLGELGIFEAVRQRFEDGMAWEEIPFFQEMRRSLEEGRPQFKYRSLEDLPRQWERIDRLHETLRRERFRSQAELGTQRPWDEIVVAFDRRGRMVFLDGRHRLALARVLGFERVPALVAVRHRRWAGFCGELRAAVAAGGGKSYQPLLHPDLADVPSRQGDDRFQLIMEHLPVRNGPLLDIGANKGYFCHRFEAAGFACVAVERSAREAYFLIGLRDACERSFDIVNGDVAEALPGRSFQVVLALNVFHHFLKSEAGFGSLQRLLGRLDTRFLVFEPHLPGDRQMRGAYRDFGPEEFVRFILDGSSLTAARPIGRAGDGRPLFLLSR